MIFEQHGAQMQYTRAVKDLSNAKGQNSWIGEGGQTNRAARSPDLMPCDLNMTGYVKIEVYQFIFPRKIQLRRRLPSLIQSISTEILQNV